MSSDFIKVNGAGWEPPPLPSVQNMGWAMSRRCDAMDGQTQGYQEGGCTWEWQMENTADGAELLPYLGTLLKLPW